MSNKAKKPVRVLPPEKEQYRGMSLSQRLVKIRQDIRLAYLQKTEMGSSGRDQYPIVTYDQVVSACRAALNDADIMVWMDAVSGSYQKLDKLTVIEFAITFEFGQHSRVVRAYGEGHDGGDKGANKAATYAMKTALLKTFLIETGENEEAIKLDLDDDQSPISAKELEALTGLAMKAKADVPGFIAYLNGQKGLSLKSLADLPAKFLPYAVGKLNAKLSASKE